jgi:DNA-directed RNA polymerase specialized sigma24 family protein
MTIPEIAEAMGEDKEVIAKTLQRALEKLKKSSVLKGLYER